MPAAQTTGGALVDAHCMPSGQSVHAVSPSRLYCPAEHAVVPAVGAAQLTPAGHGSQAVLAPFARLPVLQIVQAVLPWAEKRPAVHAVATVVEQLEPAGQTVQLAAAAAEKKPALHVWQAEEPSVENSPALHGVPALLVAAHRSPAGQRAQLELPAEVERRPAGQSVQAVAPVNEYRPATQSTGAAFFAAHDDPAGQTTQLPAVKRTNSYSMRH